MTTTSFPQQQYPDDVAVITLADKTILLVGTAHISQQSTDLVKKIKWLCINLSIMLIFHNKIKLISQMRLCYEDAWNNLA